MFYFICVFQLWENTNLIIVKVQCVLSGRLVIMYTKLVENMEERSLQSANLLSQSAHMTCLSDAHVSLSFVLRLSPLACVVWVLLPC